jgi:hypothetical protein
MLSIGELYGGLRRDPSYGAMSAVGEAPGELAEPPTGTEWRLYRAARDAHAFAANLDWYQALSLFPEGPWRQEDRAFLTYAAVRALEDGALGLLVSQAIARRPTPDDRKLLDALYAASPREDRAYLRRLRRGVEEELGDPAHYDAEAPDDGDGEEDDWPDLEEE